jgi:ligand-binding sensor domain-containing protein
MQTVSTSLISSLAAVMVWAGAARALEPESIEPESAIRTWHKGHGLLADSVTAIIQTRDGFLWVGTSEGVGRFDGVKFTTVPLGQSAAQAPVWVTALCEDSRGYVWIGTQQDGLFKLEQGRVRHYTRASGLLDDNVTSLAADSQGLVWIGTRSGLNVHSDRGFKAFTIGNGLRDQLVSGIHVARSGTIWITTRRGMCQFVEGRIVAYPLQTDSSGRSPEYLGVYEDRRRNQWAYGDTYLVNLGGGGKRFNYFRGNEAVSIRTLCEGRDGRLWIGTSGRGLICFDNDRFQPVILDKLRGPHDVRAICEDREGNLWLGTKAGGLIQLRPQPVQVLKTGSLSDSPTALATDAHGRVFVGLARAGIFVAESGRFERFGGGEGLAVQDFVSSLAVSRDDAVWAGTLGSGLYVFRNGRGVRFTTGNGLADDSVRSVCVDVEGQVWAATGAGTIHRFTEQTVARYDLGEKLIGSPVSVIAPAHSGGIWLGTDRGWIARGERGEFVVRHRAEPAARRPVLAPCMKAKLAGFGSAWPAADSLASAKTRRPVGPLPQACRTTPSPP